MQPKTNTSGTLTNKSLPFCWFVTGYFWRFILAYFNNYNNNDFAYPVVFCSFPDVVMAQVPLLAISESGALGNDIDLQQMPGSGKCVNDALIRHEPENNLERGSEESHGYAETQKKRSIFDFRHRNALFEGWKFTIFLAFMASLTVLFFNVGFVLYSTTHNGGETDTILYEGDCEKVHRLSIGFHLLINTLSTVLLGASNFGMVCITHLR